MEDIKIKCSEKECGKEFIFAIHEQKFFEKQGFTAPKRCRACREKRRKEKDTKAPPVDGLNGDKNWDVKCMVCGGVPTVGKTELCGPCCFGEADTIGGNW